MDFKRKKYTDKKFWEKGYWIFFPKAINVDIKKPQIDERLQITFYKRLNLLLWNTVCLRRDILEERALTKRTPSLPYTTGFPKESWSSENHAYLSYQRYTASTDLQTTLSERII